MNTIYKNRKWADEASEKLKVYAQPQRLMILSYLLQGENSVSEIDAATNIGQPALSQQLAALRRAQVVQTRRDGKQIWYDLADDSARLCVRMMEALLTDAPDPKIILKAATSHASSHKESQNLSDGPSSKNPSSIIGAAGFAKIL